MSKLHVVVSAYTQSVRDPGQPTTWSSVHSARNMKSCSNATWRQVPPTGPGLSRRKGRSQTQRPILYAPSMRSPCTDWLPLPLTCPAGLVTTLCEGACSWKAWCPATLHNDLLCAATSLTSLHPLSHLPLYTLDWTTSVSLELRSVAHLIFIARIHPSPVRALSALATTERYQG